MGGTTSSSKSRDSTNFDLYLKALQRDREKYLLARNSLADNQQDASRCLPYINAPSCLTSNRRNILPNTDWKTYLLDQLKGLKNTEWAIQLLKILKSWNYDSSDLMYQSQIQWIEFSNNRSPKITGNHLVIDEASIVSKSENKTLHNDESKNNEHLDEDAISRVLDPIDLLEESFYAAHGRLPSPRKTASIHRNRPSQPQSEKNSFLLSRDRFNVNNSQVLQKSISSYKNNTFINHVPPIISVNNDGLHSQVQPADNNQLLQSISNYKLITDLIEKHLQSSSNIFQKLIAKFSEFFTNKYEKVIRGTKTNKLSREISLKSVDAAVSDLQQFIRLLYESINLFYSLDTLKLGEMNTKESLFNRDNMINFTTSVVLTERLHKVVFELLRIYDLDTEEKFLKNLSLCRKMVPEDAGISSEFCLNRKTLDYYSEGENSASIIHRDEDHKTEQRSPAKNLLKEPYSQCINALKRIQIQRSPIHKLKTIVKTAELINASIRSFYQEFKIDKSFKLDSDQTLSILLYIVAKSELSNLSTHIKIIEKFTTSNVLNSVSGYYATNLEACINCIINMDPMKKSEFSRSKSLLKTSNGTQETQGENMC